MVSTFASGVPEEFLHWAAEISGPGNHVGVWQLSSLYRLLAEVRSLPGAVVDLGCGTGRWGAYFALALAANDRPESVFCCDCFPVGPWSSQGCARSEVVCDREAGARAVLESFEQLGVKTAPTILAGWFADTLEKGLPQEICLAHIDVGAEKRSVHEALTAVYPRLVPGGICVMEGYGLGFTPCVMPTTDSFLSNKPEKIEITVGGIQAIFRKLAWPKD